jgi:hypothetical protein
MFTGATPPRILRLRLRLDEPCCPAPKLFEAEACAAVAAAFLAAPASTAEPVCVCVGGLCV